MSNDLRELAKNYTNGYLLEQYYLKRESYVPAAVEILKDEIARRGISQEETDAFVKMATEKPQTYDRGDFVPFDEQFSQTDILLASSILRELEIPFFLDNPGQSALPTELEAVRRYSIHVHKDFSDKAHAALAEHFYKSGGVFAQKELGLHGQLKAINFCELRLPDTALTDRVKAQFSPHERAAIACYARKLVNEADAVEEREGRTLFYYDNLEDLAAKFEEEEPSGLTIADILASMEVLQVYCGEPDFPADLDETIRGLLTFIESLSRP
jgi:hypothetical protein